jgi:hypothetical protein
LPLNNLVLAQTFKACTGLALSTAAIEALFNILTNKQKKFYQPANQEQSTDQSQIADFAGLSQSDHAALLYSAFNAGEPDLTDQTVLIKPSPTSQWDSSAPLGDQEFDEIIKKLAFEDDSPFEFVKGVRQYNKGGLGAVAYREKETNKIHIFVAGLEIDAPLRDTLPDLHQLLFAGMQDQIEALGAFIKDLNTEHQGKIASITGQSIGAIPVAKIAYELKNPSLKTILVEPRMNDDLAKQLFLNSNKATKFTKWYQENITLLLSEPNAWNIFRVSSLGEKPAILSDNVYVFTDNGEPVVTDLPLWGMTILGFHRASNSVRKVANGKFDVNKVDSKSVPTTAAEVLQYRGFSEIAVAATLGLITNATFVAMATHYLQNNLNG